MMDDQIKNCDVNNTLLSINTSTIKEEANSVDDKIDVFESVVIKAELPSYEEQCNIINDSVKIEEGINASNVKIEFDNGLLYCEHCQVNYIDYCNECGMLVHILNRNTPDNSNNRALEELPNDILEIQHLFVQVGILALKVIPEGVKFGPFTGLHKTESTWKIKRGKFVVDKDISQYLHWMQYINPARNTLEGNLIVRQCEGYIYYLSTRQIQPGEELLVYFGEEFKDSLNENVEVDFIPAVEDIIKDVFACTFCCLGFSSKSYLAKHKTICLGDTANKFSFEDLTQCPFCKIHFGQKEYLDHHFVYCSGRNVRKDILATPLSKQATVALSGRKKCHRLIYKCEQCKYRTKHQVYLKAHVKQHNEVKLYKNTHVKKEQSRSPDQEKTFKCSLCVFRSKHKQSVRRHIKQKHWKHFDYKCDTCKYRTNHKDHLEIHIKTKHVQKFDYKCDSCGFGTNSKSHLERHKKTIHLKEFDHRCDFCEFGTNNKSNLEYHVKTKHFKEFDYNCDSCQFRTNIRTDLKRHIKAKHLQECDYKCDSCEFRTNGKRNLEIHVKSEHAEKNDYKCASCEFRTDRVDHFEFHAKTNHLEKFEYKCEKCEFTANNEYHIEYHIKTKHLECVTFKCDLCEYKTNRNDHFERHLKGKHLKEFDYKCYECEYRTNRKDNLAKHKEKKHL